MFETPKLLTGDTDAVVAPAETGMDGVDLTPIIEKIVTLGDGTVNDTYSSVPVVFNHKGVTKYGDVMFRTESGTFVVWPPKPPVKPGQATGNLGMIPLKPYRVKAEDLRPIDPNTDAQQL